MEDFGDKTMDSTAKLDKGWSLTVDELKEVCVDVRKQLGDPSAHGRKLRGLAAQTIAALSADATGRATLLGASSEVVPLLARLTADPTDDGDEGRGVAFDALTALVNCAADGDAAVEVPARRAPRAALRAPAPRVFFCPSRPGPFLNPPPSSRLSSSSSSLSTSTRRQMLLAARWRALWPCEFIRLTNCRYSSSRGRLARMASRRTRAPCSLCA